MENALTEEKLSVRALKRQAGVIRAAWDGRNFDLALDFIIRAIEDIPQRPSKSAQKERNRLLADAGYMVGVAQMKEVSSTALLAELIHRFGRFVEAP